MSRTYHGTRDRVRGTVAVTVTAPGRFGGASCEDLLPEASQRLRNLSPAGFNWGDRGGGPAQLALAILLDALGSSRKALELYQSFRADVVARLPDTWTLTGDQILDWLAGRWLDPTITAARAAEFTPESGERGRP